MNPSDLLMDIDARGVATLTLNRASRGNAYTPALLSQLAEILARLQDDPTVRVLLLRGNGKHFCVGADISIPREEPTTSKPVGLSDVCLALDSLHIPTVALVQGACIGGGVAVIACCDIVIAERASFYSIPEVRIGLSPGPISPFFIRAMGARQTRRYGLTGDRFTAHEANDMGLVHTLEESVLDAAVTETLVKSLLLGAPRLQAEFKRTVAEVEHKPIKAELLAKLQQQFSKNSASSEAVEGRAAFAGKRNPAWYPNSPPN